MNPNENPDPTSPQKTDSFWIGALPGCLGQVVLIVVALFAFQHYIGMLLTELVVVTPIIVVLRKNGYLDTSLGVLVSALIGVSIIITCASMLHS